MVQMVQFFYNLATASKALKPELMLLVDKWKCIEYIQADTATPRMLSHFTHHRWDANGPNEKETNTQHLDIYETEGS